MVLYNYEHQKNIIQTTAALSGIAAFIIGIPGLIIIGGLKPGYNLLCHTISELGEYGGYNYRIARFLFIVTGIFEVFFALGLMSILRKNRPAVTGAILIICHGIFDNIGSGIFPCDPGRIAESFSGQMHYLVSAIRMLALVIAPFFFWRAFFIGRRFSGNRLHYSTALVALFTAAAAVAFNISFFSNTLVGLTQRMVYFPYYVLILVISIKMLKDKNQTTENEK
ncbi:MAG: DUF998 domain-containing protein [Deltaproteobacteria bacterium]|nr:DUF998 domain-containing protein [Deltaproteobacteria bacterium]